MFGYKKAGSFEDTSNNARITLLTSLSGPTIELIEPLSPDPEAGIGFGNRPGPYHCCFEVVDLKKAIETLESEGFRVIVAPKPALSFGGRHVSFLWSQKVGMIELLEASR